MTYAQFWGNLLFLMAKPAPDLAALLASHLRADPRRVDRLHITLLPVGFAEPALLAMLIAALEDFAAPAFRVCFNRIHGSAETVALRGNETMQGAVRFQAALRDHLVRKGVALGVYGFRPHITLRYQSDGRGSEAIDAISWRVEDFRLIESVQREGCHIERGRWQLGTASTPPRYPRETRALAGGAPLR